MIALGTSVALSVTIEALQRPGFEEPVAALAEGATEEERREWCLDELRTLESRLRRRAVQMLAEASDPGKVTEDWTNWSAEWRQSLSKVRVGCNLRHEPSLRDLRQLATDVERMQMAYTTSLMGFAEVGRKALPRVREAFGPPR